MTADLEAALTAVLARRAPRRVTVEGTRDAAVLIPIVAETEPELIFTLRSESVATHKGQISFPGGAIDAGETPETAALREAEEELGIDASSVRTLGMLDAVPTYVSGFVVFPVVGWLHRRPALTPSPGEVAAVLEVPLADLGDDIRVDAGFTRDGRTYPTEAWIWNEHVIWGVTARILRLFLTHAADAGFGNRPAAPTTSREEARFSSLP